MNEFNHIDDDSQEENLRNIAPVLSGIRKADGLRVPEGYFDRLSERVMDRIETLELAPELARIPKADPQNVPASYFEELPDLIQAQIRLEELKTELQTEPAPLYFEELGTEIESRVVLEKLAISKEEPYRVPADYFEWLPSVIQDRILAQRKPLFSWEGLKALLVPRVLVPAGLSLAILILFGISFLNSPEKTTTAPVQLALNEKDKKEVKENPELYGIDEAVVLEHISAKAKTKGNANAGNADDEAAIDYLIDNNADISTLSSENQ